MPEISHMEENGVHFLNISGEVDASSSVALDKAISACVDAGAARIIVDCSRLDYISSAGLGVFMSYVEDFRIKQIRMILFGLNERVKHTFDLLGLADLLTIVNGRTDALLRIHEK